MLAARVIAASGKIAAGPTLVQQPGEISGGFGASTMGDRLAVVRFTTATNAPTFLVGLYDESLALVASGALDSPAPITGLGAFASRVSIARSELL